MQLVTPEIVAEARQLSPVVPGTGLVLGLLLWTLGGWSHRFWLALLLTLSAGLLGLSYGQAAGLQPLVAGLLLAVAAGALALSLVRILVFAAGGVAAMGVMQVVAPSWDEPVLILLLGGLIGILLYRFWIIIFASFLGTLLMSYSTLALLDRLGKLNSMEWVERNGPLLSWGCGCITVLGALVQLLLERWRARRRAKARDEEAPILTWREWGLKWSEKLLKRAG